MSKKPRKRRDAYSFPVAKIFPSSDPLAVDLLRLMAGYNDLAYIVAWTDAHKRIPGIPAALTLAAGRWFLQLRLMAAILHEILDVLDSIQKLSGFRDLEGSLDRDAQAALDQLRSVRAGGDGTINRVLERTRDKTTFHFDRGKFRNGLNRMLARFGQDCKSTVLAVYEGTPQEVRPHYVLADEIRTEIAFGLTGAGGGQEELVAVINLVRALTTFLDGLFKAYLEDRGLESQFTLKE